MMRKALLFPTALGTLSTSFNPSISQEQKRFARYANIREALKPIPGQGAGQMSILNEICCNPDAEEERRKPIFRMEVKPMEGNAIDAEETSYLRDMYEWGFNSLTLFKKVNEDPGPWWNANATTLVSNWSQIGDYANAGMWSGVWRYTYGVGEYNLRPYELRGRAWGKKDKKTGAVRIPFQSNTNPIQKLTFPHTKEHIQHRRLKNPNLIGTREIPALHGKRLLREVQYHLGQGLRFYLIDGIFGSHPSCATPYRIITDNPTHAYFATLAAIRKFNYVAQQEIMLVKRISQSPIDEWGWRRPGVVIYHAPAYDFEQPRIVEEFGGPRPQDLSLSNNRFITYDPYSIPMRAMIGGEPSCEALLDTTAFLCARWGYYADDQGLITLQADSIMSPDGSHLTLVVTSNSEQSDILRSSPWLFGARHHRIANGAVSRAWDVTSISQNEEQVKNAGGIHPNDLIEESTQQVHKSLPVRLGLNTARSHRQFGRRHVSGFGFKYPHNYTNDPATRASAGGHLFKPLKGKGNELEGHPSRPSAFKCAAVDLIVVSDKGESIPDIILEKMKATSFIYAEEDKLKQSIAEALKQLRSTKVVSSGEATQILTALASKQA